MKKTQEVQDVMDAADTVLPTVVEPVPFQLAQQLHHRHSFTATGADRGQRGEGERLVLIYSPQLVFFCWAVPFVQQSLLGIVFGNIVAFGQRANTLSMHKRRGWCL